MPDCSMALPAIHGNKNVQTMSSREIAELVDARHDSVKRTIERLVEKGIIVQPPTVDEPETDAMGRPRAVKVYAFAGEQGKRDSIIVVAQLCPEFTARLVDRWQELERTAARNHSTARRMPHTDISRYWRAKDHLEAA